MVKIPAKPVTSMASLKRSLKKKGGGGDWIRRVPANGSMSVRFLSEPDSGNWVSYYEHFNTGSRRYYPCPDGEAPCPGCDADVQRSFRYLTSALDIDNDRVVALKIPKTLMNQLQISYEKYETLVDRDYELTSTGVGTDTVYDRTPEAPHARKIDKYDLIDLDKTLSDAWDEAWGGGEDEEEEPAVTKSKPSVRARKPAKVADEPEEDEDELVEEDDDEFDEDDSSDEDSDSDEGDDYYTREELLALSMGELRALATPNGILVRKGMTKGELVDALLAGELVDALLAGDESTEDLPF